MVQGCPHRENFRVEQPTPGHFYWPDLDVDLGLESIEHPDRFPLKATVTPDPSLEQTR